jgi:hypothetical protein
MFFDVEKIIFENFNNFENNIISVELAKVLGYQVDMKHIKYPFQRSANHRDHVLYCGFLACQIFKILGSQIELIFFSQNFD